MYLVEGCQFTNAFSSFTNSRAALALNWGENVLLAIIL